MFSIGLEVFIKGFKLDVLTFGVELRLPNVVKCLPFAKAMLESLEMSLKTILALKKFAV